MNPQSGRLLHVWERFARMADCRRSAADAFEGAPVSISHLLSFFARRHSLWLADLATGLAHGRWVKRSGSAVGLLEMSRAACSEWYGAIVDRKGASRRIVCTVVCAHCCMFSPAQSTRTDTPPRLWPVAVACSSLELERTRRREAASHSFRYILLHTYDETPAGNSTVIRLMWMWRVRCAADRTVVHVNEREA